MNAALRDGAELEESKSIPTSILIITGVHNVFILLLQTRTRKKVKLRALKKMQVRMAMLHRMIQMSDLCSLRMWITEPIKSSLRNILSCVAKSKE